MSREDEQVDDTADQSNISGINSVSEHPRNEVAEEAKQLAARMNERKEKREPSLQDRNRGILSSVDRKFLFGEKEYEHKQSVSNRKQDIRNRVSNSFQDFILLSSLMRNSEKQKIFQSEMDDIILDESLKKMISFVYNGIDRDRSRLEDIISRGVHEAINENNREQNSGEATHVSTIIDIQRKPDVDRLYDKLQSGEANQLTDNEVGALIRSGKLNSEDIEELEKSDESSSVASGLASLLF